jgi:hypothetical protein
MNFHDSDLQWGCEMIEQDVAKTAAKIRSMIDNGEPIVFCKAPL